MGRFKEAEEQYKLALEADPNNIPTYYYYGNLLEYFSHIQQIF